MNKTIKRKIENVLKAEMEYTKRADITEEERVDRMKDIVLLKQYLNSLDERTLKDDKEDYEKFRL